MHEHLPHSWNFTYVALSYVIASVAAFVSLQFASRARTADGSARTFYITTQGLLLGFGIWAMHFIGMLAFQLATPVGYDLTLTVVSGVAAVTFLTAALYLVYSGTLTHVRLAGGGLLAGFGICVMHYVGMAAMRLDATTTYAPLPFALSVLIAVSAASVALFLFERVGSDWARRQAGSLILSLKTIAALVMGVAIIGMHYTGMAAVRYGPGQGAALEQGADASFLGLMVLIGSLFVFGLAFMILAMDREDAAIATSGD